MAVSAAVLGFTVVVAGALTPAYSYRADTVSQLGSAGQPYALLERGGVTLYGLLVIVGAKALGRRAPGKERLLAGAVTLYGGAAVAAGVAPKDLPRATHTVLSQVHVDATVAGGLGILVAMVVVVFNSPSLVERRATSVVASVTAAGVVVFARSWGSANYGLVERGLLVLAALWLVGLALGGLYDGHAEPALVLADEFGEAVPTTGATVD